MMKVPKEGHEQRLKHRKQTVFGSVKEDPDGSSSQKT